MNKISTLLKSITSNALYDFVKEQFKVIIGLIISLPFILKFREQVLKVLTSEIQIWVAILIVLFLALIIYGFQKLTKHNFVKYGLIWDVKIRNKHVIEIQGPFCTNCGYQLSNSDFINNNQCPKCSKKYPTNEDTIENLSKKVISIVEADLRVGNVLNIDWFISSYPDSILYISNNGSFIVKDINIDINMDINNEQYHIGTYSIVKISSDEIIKIDDPNPMNKVNQILNDLKLIESKVYIFEDFQEDERRNAIYFDREIEWNELVKEFSSRLNICIAYSLRKKRKSTKAKYSLKFKHMHTPPEYPDYIDNFEVSLSKIE